MMISLEELSMEMLAIIQSENCYHPVYFP